MKKNQKKKVKKKKKKKLKKKKNQVTSKLYYIPQINMNLKQVISKKINYLNYIEIIILYQYQFQSLKKKENQVFFQNHI